MSPTYIALLILMGVGIMAGVAFAVQDYENKKREKSLRLMRLKAAIRRASHLLESLPPLLMTQDVHAMLTKYLEVRWNSVVELEKSETNRQQYENFRAIAAGQPELAGHPEGSMTVFSSHDEAAQALGIVKELAEFITDVKNKNEVSADLCDNLMREAKRSYNRIDVDIDLMRAHETEVTRGEEVAIHHYRSCFSKLQNLNHNHSLDRQLYEIRTHMTQLAERIEQEHEEKRLEEEKAKDSGKKFNF